MALTPWKKLSEKTLAEGWHREFRVAQFLDPNGKETEYFYFSAQDAVMVIGVTGDGKVPMIRQWRPLFEKAMVEFPAGGRESKDPVADARREFLEEAKMAAEHIEWVARQEACPGVLDMAMDVYVAWGLRAEESGHDEMEEFEHLLLTPAEIDDAIRGGELTNGMCISAWHQARPRVLQLIDQLGSGE